ncbi:MAG TPA: YceI family protein [Jatrophihabitans sp.]|nr:YceI family protein [Jatrophihabitans sp.]
MTTTAPAIPGYLTGTWQIDPTHSDVSFSVRHMMVSKVKGRFGTFSGTIVTAENPLESSVTAEIDAASIDTNQAQRDNHIRSADFFEVAKYPTITFTSTSVEPKGDDFLVHGDLTIKGNTRSVPLKLELNGFGPDAYGGTRAGFTATTEISRKEFGVDIDMPMDGGGVVVGDKITITLEIEAVLQQG